MLGGALSIPLSCGQRACASLSQPARLAGLTVVAANAGGAWSPIGDVTTTMLWMGGEITAGPLVSSVFLPSVACTAGALGWHLYATRTEPKTFAQPAEGAVAGDSAVPGSALVAATGIGGLLFVPVFKSLTGLPPFAGMLLSAGVLWGVTDALQVARCRESSGHASSEPWALVCETGGRGGDGRGRRATRSSKCPTHSSSSTRRGRSFSSAFSWASALSRAPDFSPSSQKVWSRFPACAPGNLAGAEFRPGVRAALGSLVTDDTAVATIIGAASAVIDNVPLVAAAMGMYDMTTYPVGPA
jgi:hypothetical protein